MRIVTEGLSLHCILHDDARQPEADPWYVSSLSNTQNRAGAGARGKKQKGEPAISGLERV